MKEITRRLYTKPVMLGMAFLVGVVLVAGLFITVKSRASAQTIFIQHGNDEFETTGNGETYHNFSASKVPVDFFGPGSNEYSGVVPLVGVPLAPGSDTDTVISRNEDVYIPGHPSTTLTMTGFSLKSINPITVTYSNGTPTETWNVEVGLSAYKSSTGSMTINAGGTFDSSLKVWPKFTFTRVGGGKPPLVLDTGAPGGPGLTAGAIAAGDGMVFEPAPAPTAAPAPCVAINDFEGTSRIGGSFNTAAAASSCAPVTLTSTNSPWQPCPPNGFCVPRPITEQELLASHNASPKGTKKALAAKQVAVGE